MTQKNVLLFLGPKGPLTFGATRQKKIATYRSSHFSKKDEKMNWKKSTFVRKGTLKEFFLCQCNVYLVDLCSINSKSRNHYKLVDNLDEK